MAVFLDAHDVAAIVNETGLESFWLRLHDYLRHDFLRWEEFDKSPRSACHFPSGVIELMPASDHAAYAFKFVNGHPGNTRRGLQTVVAFGALADVETGYPLLLADMTLATAFRTGAASALAARSLARPDSRTMAIIGLGAQSEFQACAFRVIMGVDNLRIFDIDPRAAEKFARNMARFDVSIIRCSSAEEATVDADIVTTITADKKRATVLSGNMIGAGAHINALGGDCPGKTEISRDLLLRSNIFVEYAPQTRLEGEIQQLAPDHPVTEIWETISGAKPGRRSEREITLFDGVGFAVEDFSVLRLLMDLSRETGVGQTIELVAELADPKNLFGLLQLRNNERRYA
ncbi:ornithine cyclodeaminase [Methylocystis heyeri]|uniref:Ornithine cyclodeaminase n=1 Tax=Methylocystis heyeri TaxID=391905 RepID=A0A6B8KDY3_9HYPH|nr:ornithine cyclodeaminase [Methylocystis heyeri]QGM45812.1 ornithine cyclodeaminase [Methylocystis heyeri]